MEKSSIENPTLIALIKDAYNGFGDLAHPVLWKWRGEMSILESGTCRPQTNYFVAATQAEVLDLAVQWWQAESIGYSVIHDTDREIQALRNELSHGVIAPIFRADNPETNYAYGWLTPDMDSVYVYANATESQAVTLAELLDEIHPGEPCIEVEFVQVAARCGGRVYGGRRGYCIVWERETALAELGEVVA